MPQFLDFVFPFGEQESRKDFHFSGFRKNDRYNNINCAVGISEIGRSGKQYEMCYNLRSAEPTTSPPEWPWSIRQAAVYHSFDTVSGRAVWIIVKGNRLMYKRIRNAIENKVGQGDRCAFGSLGQSFLSSLKIQLIFCDWARENWRWYINFLEDEIRKLTDAALHAPIEQPSTPTSIEKPSLLRSKTAPDPSQKARRVFSWATTSQERKVRRAVTLGAEAPMATNATNEKRGAVTVIEEEPVRGNTRFDFSSLQRIQKLQEKTDETLLALTMNINIIQDLSRYYKNLQGSPHWPDGFVKETEEHADRFHLVVSEATTDMEMQRSRLENLRRMLDDRKALVSGVLSMFVTTRQN